METSETETGTFTTAQRGEHDVAVEVPTPIVAWPDVDRIDTHAASTGTARARGRRRRLDRRAPAAARRDIRQLSRPQIAGVWAAAAVPMALAAWVVAPRLAHSLGEQGLLKALLLVFTAGLVWQGVLVALLVGVEQRSLRWSALRDALWLRAPQGPTTGRPGGRAWLVVLPLIVAFGAKELFPSLPHPGGRDFGKILSSPAGHAFFHGAWGWFALTIVMFAFNTVFGEELLFRGYLLPRMQAAFSRRAWVANGVLFAAYHLHVPWVIPATLLDAAVLAYPSQRYRSAWIGIIVHSAQSIFLALALLGLVLR